MSRDVDSVRVSFVIIVNQFDLISANSFSCVC